MTIAETMLPEFDHEMAGVRKLLELSPDTEWGWRPHPKSWTLGELASHLVNLLEWTAMTLESDEIDIAPKDGESWKATGYDDRAAALAAFDANLTAARAAIAAVSDAALFEPWTLRSGEHVVFTMPKAGVLRSFILNHAIHHRAQLGLYLRLRDVAVPGLYGPSADDV